MRVAHISDTHLGYAQYNLVERKLDFMRAFEMAVDRILEMGIDVVIHTGDMFESSQPDMFTFSKAIEQLSRLKEKGIEVVAITGNHDRTLRKGKIPPQRVLKDLGLLRLIEPYGCMDLDGMVVCGFQFMPRAFVEVMKEEKFGEFSERASGGNFSILMFHQAIASYLPYADSYEMFISDLPEGFDYYAGGHIHSFIKENVGSGILSYSGSTEFRSSREAAVEGAVRGFNVVDTESGKFLRVNLEGLRSFLVYNLSEEDAGESLKRIADEVSAHDKPVVFINYTFRSYPIDSFREELSLIGRNCLSLRISSRRISEESAVRESITLKEVVEDYFRDFPVHVREIASEIASAQVEQVRGVLEKFTEEVTGKDWKSSVF